MTISLKKNNSVQFKHSKVFAQSTKRQRFKRPTWVVWWFGRISESQTHKFNNTKFFFFFFFEYKVPNGDRNLQIKTEWKNDCVFIRIVSCYC